MSYFNEAHGLLHYNMDFFNLPLSVEDGFDVMPAFFKKAEEYISLLEGKEHLKDIHKRAKLIIRKLKEAIDAYWKGDISKANNAVKLILKDDKKLGRKLFVEDINKCLNIDIRRLYKARAGEFYNYKRAEMFHIPFNKRGSVKNQRYSINGMPCLYLGTSAYVCWEELNRPDFKDAWISRYEVENSNLKILNLTYTAHEIKSMLEKEREEALSKFEKFISMWIIKCGCSIIVKNKKRIFKEEYIIPQLLMQNIRKKKIDGIMYLSVKNNQTNRKNFLKAINLAFPADDYQMEKQRTQEIENNYLSENIKNTFSLTNPINMGLINAEIYSAISATKADDRYHALCKGRGKSYLKSNKLEMNSIKLSLPKDYELNYVDTVFYLTEEKLRCMFAERLN